jgi:hypothetical protein
MTIYIFPEKQEYFLTKQETANFSRKTFGLVFLYKVKADHSYKLKTILPHILREIICKTEAN